MVNKQLAGPVIAGMLCAFAGMVGYVLGESRGRESTVESALTIAAPERAEPESEPVMPRCPAEPLHECEAARDELRIAVEQLTGTQAKLREDLEFYRGLVDLRQAEESVRLHSAEWTRLSAGRIVLRLVLVRTGPNRKEVQGKLQVKLRGMQEDQVREIFIERIAVGATPKMDFNFRNFHEWEIELRVPSSFKPDRLIATLEIKGHKEPIIESWTWSELES